MNEHYYDVVIEGSLDLMKGFVMGFIEGRGVAGDIFFGEEYHIESESKVGLLLQLMGFHDKTCTVIVGSGLYEVLAAALKRRQNTIPLRILKVRQVSNASFAFSFGTYSREVGEEISSLLAHLPEGIVHEPDIELHRILDPEGKGLETFTPLHDYELNGKGRISGSVKGVFELYHRLQHYEVVELGNMDLT
jgi:hypothetical protein